MSKVEKSQILRNLQKLELEIQKLQPAFLSNSSEHECEACSCTLIAIVEEPNLCRLFQEIVNVNLIKPEEVWWCQLSNKLHICNEYLCCRRCLTKESQWVCRLTGRCYEAQAVEGDARRLYTIAAARDYQHKSRLESMRNGAIRNRLQCFVREANIKPYFRKWLDSERFLQNYCNSVCEWQTRLQHEQNTKQIYEDADCWLDFGAAIAQRNLRSSSISPRLYLDDEKRDALVDYYSQRVLALWNMLRSISSSDDEIMSNALKLNDQTVALLTFILAKGIVCVQSGKVIVPAEDLLNVFGEIPHSAYAQRRVRSDVTGACSLKQHVERILLERLRYDQTLHIDRFLHITELLQYDTAKQQRSTANVDSERMRSRITC